MAKLFISYRRSADLDAELARFLYEGLTAAGHEVFIDYQMPIGTNWAIEIGDQIKRCDHMVVLLSEESAYSEMVQGEIRHAHQSRKADGQPTILPIRLRFPGGENYELNSYLGPIQYIQMGWRGRFAARPE